MEIVLHTPQSYGTEVSQLDTLISKTPPFFVRIFPSAGKRPVYSKPWRPVKRTVLLTHEGSTHDKSGGHHHSMHMCTLEFMHKPICLSISKTDECVYQALSLLWNCQRFFISMHIKQRFETPITIQNYSRVFTHENAVSSILFN